MGSSQAPGGLEAATANTITGAGCGALAHRQQRGVPSRCPCESGLQAGEGIVAGTTSDIAHQHQEKHPP
jgi:hypothetical protein